MHGFNIAIHSFEEVQAFVSMATVWPFRIMVSNDHQQINAKSFMGMLGLDYSSPLRVDAECSDEEFQKLLHSACRFRV